MRPAADSADLGQRQREGQEQGEGAELGDHPPAGSDGALRGGRPARRGATRPVSFSALATSRGM